MSGQPDCSLVPSASAVSSPLTDWLHVLSRALHRHNGTGTMSGSIVRIKDQTSRQSVRQSASDRFNSIYVPSSPFRWEMQWRKRGSKKGIPFSCPLSLSLYTIYGPIKFLVNVRKKVLCSVCIIFASEVDYLLSSTRP